MCATTPAPVATTTTRATDPDRVRPRRASRSRALADGVVTALITLLAAFILAVASTVRLAMEPATYAAGMMGLGGAKDTKREGPTKQRTTRDDDAERGRWLHV